MLEQEKEYRGARKDNEIKERYDRFEEMLTIVKADSPNTDITPASERNPSIPA